MVGVLEEPQVQEAPLGDIPRVRSIFARLAALSVGVALVGCGNEPAVGIPVDDEVQASTREVVPSIVRGAEGNAPKKVDLRDTVSREELTSKILAFGELTPLDQKVVTTVTNTVEAPCGPCEGRTFAACLVEMPEGCENLNELLDRTVQMVNSGATPSAIRGALVYTDIWMPLPALSDDRPVEGERGAMPIEVWIDPATSSVRPVIDTLDQLDLRSAFVVFRIAPFSDDPAHTAWAAAAIAAESQGKLEVFLRAVRSWRDEQRDVQGKLDLDVTAADLDIVIRSLADTGIDPERFELERASPAVAQRIAQDRALSEKVGIRVAPSWFVDGYRLRGAQSAGAIQRVINVERIDYLQKSSAGNKEE